MSISASPADTILYCKARGMPFDHVDGNAILTFCGTCDGKIHGAELECSYAGCRTQGPKFRYCGFCKSAVSKRNFRKRHAHGMQFSNPQGKRTPQPYFTTPFDPESVQRISFERKRSAPDSSQGVQIFSSSQYASSLDDLKTSSCCRIFAAPSPIKVTGTSSHIPKISNLLNQKQTDPTQVHEVPEDWAVLYQKRPRTGDSDGIKSWLLSALDVAGLKPDENVYQLKTGDSDDTPWFCDDSDIDIENIKNESTGYAMFRNFSPAPFPGSKLTTPLYDEEKIPSFSSNHNCIPKYKIFADSLSLHIETEAGGISNLNDVLPLDSDGSMIKI